MYIYIYIYIYVCVYMDVYTHGRLKGNRRITATLRSIMATQPGFQHHATVSAATQWTCGGCRRCWVCSAGVAGLARIGCRPGTTRNQPQQGPRLAEMSEEYQLFNRCPAGPQLEGSCPHGPPKLPRGELLGRVHGLHSEANSQTAADPA